MLISMLCFLYETQIRNKKFIERQSERFRTFHSVGIFVTQKLHHTPPASTIRFDIPVIRQYCMGKCKVVTSL